MREVNKVLINKLFDELENGIISLGKCKQEVLKEIDRVEDIWDSKVDDMVDMWQSKE